MVKFSFTPHGAAGVYLRLRFQDAGPDDQEQLLYRQRHPGGCKILSATMRGEECSCFLCCIDDMAKQVEQK
jgi:hypothetical protein